jgi:segregation and condensation protein B
MSETSQKIEALIFASSKPISEKEIQKRLDLHEDISEVMSNLEEAYQHRGINLKKISRGWIFLTNTEVSDIFHEKREVQKRLSKQAIETLAIIVYHQPITKAEIESIRGVNIGQGIFDQLMELGWIAPGGRKEVPGRPILWETTDDFLLHFGLGTLDNLPGIEEMKSSGLLNDNFASMNIQELTDDLEKDEAFVDEEDNEDENLDDFTQSQLTQDNDT